MRDLSLLPTVLCLSALAWGAEQDAWNQWRGADRDGVVRASPALLDAWPAEGPKVVWSSEPIPGGQGRGGYGSAVVAQNKVYLLVTRKQPTPENKDAYADEIYCLDAATGKEAWSKKYPGIAKGDHNSGSSTPCVVGNRCHVLGGHGMAYCLDATDGREIWKAAACEAVCHASFAVVGDKAVVQTKAGLHAFDAATGKELWKQPKAASESCSPVPWVANGTTYLVCNTARTVYLIKADSGEIVWEVPGGEMSTPVIAGDVMIVNATAYRLGLAKPDKALWTAPGASRGCSPLIYQGHAYVVNPRGGLCVCVELSSGKVLWQKNSIAPDGYPFGSPLLADGKIFASMNDGKRVVMIKCDTKECVVLGDAALNSCACTTPAIAKGFMYVRTGKNVVCYDIRK